MGGGSGRGVRSGGQVGGSDWGGVRMGVNEELELLLKLKKKKIFWGVGLWGSK